MSKLMWIAVPGGRTTGGDGILRALIVPMLDGPLAQEQMAVWPPPQLLADDARLLVEAATDPSAPAAVSLVVRPVVPAVPGLWQRFFGTIGVRPPGAGTGRDVDVQPTTEHAHAIISTYRAVARGLTGEDTRPAFEDMSRTRASALADAATLPTPAPGVATASGRPVDFHLATSILREHPSVLRALGLIVEVSLPAAAFTQLPARGVVRLSWPAAPAGLPAGEPAWTSYLRDRFLPAPGQGSDLHPAGGMVTLAREDGGVPVWRLHTLDVDHALRGLAAAGQSTGALPALRTAGVLLARVGRAGELRGRGARNAQPAEVLFAEHLTLGYRVDAKIFGQAWHSLCRRQSRYAVNGFEFATGLKEEGHVKIGGGIDRGDNVLRTDEVVARWDGWSLAVSRPDLRERPPETATPSTPLPFVLDTSGIEVEAGTLLRLRFGETYQLRARVADVAGGGPALSEASLDGCDSEAVRFTRHEPLLPPDVRVPPGVPDFGPGASPTALVIRAAEGIADSVADTTRDLLPPTATFEVIERHGRFDGDPTATIALLGRHDLPDPAAGGVVGFVRGGPGEPPRDLESKDWTANQAGLAPDDAWPDLRPKRVVLRARHGDEPTLDWESDELLVVRLAPAEEATLELSSLIDQRARAAFSISDWLKPGDGDEEEVSAAEDMLATGRHPMATPAHRVTVRHAVRAPRGTPHGTLEVVRVENATSGTVQVPDRPGVDPHAGVEPASTLAIDVAASWHPVDDPADPPADRRPVGRIAVGRADARIGALAQEFGDTKHRDVTYTWTAVSRFRDCFAASEDPAAFRVEGTFGPVAVPSSARPVAPVVRSVTPAFVWQEERTPTSIVRRRLGNRLRVELATPWFTTGDGEQLAVLGSDSSPTEEVAAFVSQAGRDPLWQTDVPSRFFTPVGGIEDITLAEGPKALMVAYGVFQAAGSAFADVVLEPSGSYSALVRLAVARFQRQSLPGLSISPVVRTDFVPVLPDRTLTVSAPPGGGITVLLQGIAPRGPRLNRVDAILERRVDAAVAQGAVTVGQDGTWEQVAVVSGGVAESLGLQRPDGQLRVRVREVEMIGRDTAPTFGTVAELEERVVFTDTVAL